jgi:hypothetical protein
MGPLDCRGKIIRICRNPPLFGVVTSYFMKRQVGAVVPISGLELQPTPVPFATDPLLNVTKT